MTGLSSDAAAMALNAGKGALTAVLFLEQGRDLLVMSSAETQTDVLELQENDSKLADHLVSSRDELKTAQTSAIGEPYPRAPASHTFIADQELSEQIGHVRKQSGFEDVLHAPTEPNFRKTAMYGPIVMINVSDYRCDALLIEQHRIRSLALSLLNTKNLRKKLKSEDLAALKILGWLWHSIACPILNELGFNAAPETSNELPHI